jgi:uncharacterized membrane protein
MREVTAMRDVVFPDPFDHESHPPVRNINELYAERSSRGHRAAEAVVRVVGSWRFVIIQSIILTAWVILNIVAWIRHWDPYPFILMNLFLSLQAAYTAPMILMSQNRAAERDRLVAHNDYEINQKAEREIRTVLDHLQAQKEALFVLYLELQQIRERMGMPTTTEVPPPGAPNTPDATPEAAAEFNAGSA